MNNDVVARLDPRSFRGYLLTEHRWVVERDLPDRVIYRHPTGIAVLVPTARGNDFVEIANVAVQRIAEAEKRDREDVLSDLHWFGSDRLSIRRLGANSTVPLDDAVGMHMAVHDLLLSASRFSFEAGSVPIGGKRAKSVNDYLSQVDIAPPVAGSFVMRVLLPFDEPSLRAISARAIVAMDSAVRAAGDVAAGAQLARWNEVEPDGVTTKVCAALSRLTGPDPSSGGDVEVDLTWAWSTPQNFSGSTSIRINKGLAPVLDAGAEYLRAAPEELDVRMLGRVTTLDRDDPELLGRPGDIIVKGAVEGWAGERQLRLNLSGDSYARAIRAHELSEPVVVRARVQRRPQGRWQVIQLLEVEFPAD